MMVLEAVVALYGQVYTHYIILYTILHTLYPYIPHVVLCSIPPYYIYYILYYTVYTLIHLNVVHFYYVVHVHCFTECTTQLYHAVLYA
jgi:hypothetical protein